MMVMNEMAMTGAKTAAPIEYVTYREASFPEVSTDHE
jgi:hypothetical protein